MKSGEGRPAFWKLEPLLGTVALLLLLAGCVWVMKPFLTALMWAIILAYSLYPLQQRFTRWLGGSRTLAAILVSLTVTVALAGPVVLIGMRLAKDGRELAVATREWLAQKPGDPPPWLARLPVIGDELAEKWKDFAETRMRWMEQLKKEVTAPPPRARAVSEDELDLPQEPVEPPVTAGEPSGNLVGPPFVVGEEGQAADRSNAPSEIVSLLGRLLASAYDWLLVAGLAVGHGVAQVVVSAFLTFFLLRDSSALSERLGVAVQRLAGDRGRHLVKVAGDTVHGVIYGILGTAIAQALVAWAGFWFAGVPGAVLLSVLTFLFAVVPFGPPMIWLPASLWLFTQDKTAMGVFMLLWGVIAISGVDNILRPFLISQGSKMPFALIFCGVIGGALAFGLVGVFLGPTMLAVAFRLIDEWSSVRFAGSAAPAISGLPAGADSSTPPAHGG